MYWYGVFFEFFLREGSCRDLEFGCGSSWPSGWGTDSGMPDAGLLWDGLLEESGSQWAVFFFPADVMVAPKLGLSLILFLFLMRFFFVVRKLQSSGPAIGHVKGSHVFIAKLLTEKRIGPFLCCVVKCLLNNH